MPRDDPFDPEQLRLNGTGPVNRPQAPRRLPRHRAGQPFLKGPVPWSWVQSAGRLPGKALLVGLLLWKEAGCEGGRTVRFRLAQAAALGIHPDTARRGLRCLEAAGLVRVQRPPGRCAVVTLMEAPTESDRSGPSDRDSGERPTN